jgi:hypothetical protein
MVICDRCHGSSCISRVFIGSVPSSAMERCGRQDYQLCLSCQNEIGAAAKAVFDGKKVDENVRIVPRIWPLWLFLILMSAANVGFWFWVGR